VYQDFFLSSLNDASAIPIRINTEPTTFIHPGVSSRKIIARIVDEIGSPNNVIDTYPADIYLNAQLKLE